MKSLLALALLALPVSAHRLDEYLQATLLSVSKTELQAEMTLTPGVAILPFLITDMDRDANGMFSKLEQDAYARRVLSDQSLAIDGQTLTPQLDSVVFPTMEEFTDGLGAIRLRFHATLSSGSHTRKITIENRHQSQISVYLVNSLVPRDPDIQTVTQTRSESQSNYQLEYQQRGVVDLSSAARQWLIALAAIMSAAWAARYASRSGAHRDRISEEIRS
jgi:hypothetical protein